MNLFSASALVVLQVFDIMLTEYLIESGVPSVVLIFIKSLITLLLSILVARSQNMTLKPTVPSVQIYRLLIIGLGIFLVVDSYQYISATSVALIQRLEIPALVILSTVIAVSTYSKWDKIITGLIVMVVVSMFLFSGTVDESPVGYALALGGVALLAAGTLLLKHTIHLENDYIVINTTCLSSLILCGGIIWWNDISFFLTWELLSLVLVAGVNMYLVFKLLARMFFYERPEKVRGLAIVVAVLVMITEMVVEQKFFHPLMIATNLLVLLLVGMLISAKVKRTFRILLMPQRLKAAAED